MCVQILNSRKRESDGGQEFLIKFPDGCDDEWVDEKDMAAGVSLGMDQHPSQYACCLEPSAQNNALTRV